VSTIEASLNSNTLAPHDVSTPAVPNALADLTGLSTDSFLFKANQLVKRLFDVTATTVGVMFILPLLLVIAALVGLTSDGPIIYTSTRIGKDRKPFKMYKFRTMITNADALRDQLRQEGGLEGQLFKMKNDPRITPIGSLLRATSLDELPQLLNVIKGDMSLVGPRPLPEDESNLFEGPYTTRYKVLPGITGAWQVSGRSSLTFQQLCQLELNYVRGWHCLRDLGILFKTIDVVLFRKGAY
jgi:lipopolysaccharide/colanic/teichoic acid biosynthesis glycosyltransferase